MNRIPLKSETTIKYIDKEYIVDSVIGSGATCIVYSAHYIDKVGMTHNIRLKECYPYNAAVTRVNNEIIWESESEKKQVLSSFIVGYEKLMKNQMGNYSVNAFDLVIANGTYYILMDSNEGTTFDKEKCVTIYDVLYTIKLLAYVVGEYHKNGYLHLDIKPENFLVYPRPSEHIILFDMDSITAIEDIRKGKVKSVSYSMKWAAPEQTQRKLSKICPATDIFSIGAVLFYKIMGRNVSNEDIGVFSEWDFEQPLFEKVNPKLKLHISKIFKKTLAVNINRRYQNTDELIADIDEAMECARYNSPYVMSNFPSAKSVFVGRDSELSQLRQIMNDNRVVFLSGIGGIGKTSLVLEYLRKSKREFGTILFMRYDGNIDKTLKTSDIVFRNYEDAGEEGSNIINGLSELMDENDLIILDNFDNIDNLNELNEFIDNSGIQCKIIITTRIHSSVLSDVGFCSMHIKELAQTDVEKLFYIHNGINYNDDEKRVLRGIFNNFEFHTLCVELIAKYLRIKAVKPSEFRDRIYNSLQGISSFDDVKIVEKKDNRIERRSMQKHLEVLFDITELEDKQKEIMFSLSLLGSIRISKKLFLEWLSFDDKEELLEELIECGWIECTKTNKISLHQLILDTSFFKLKDVDYPHLDIITGLSNYMKKYYELNSQQQSSFSCVLDNFFERIPVELYSREMDELLLVENYTLYISKKKTEEFIDFLRKNAEENFAALTKFNILKIVCLCDELRFAYHNEEDGNIDHITNQIKETLFEAVTYAEISLSFSDDFVLKCETICVLADIIIRQFSFWDRQRHLLCLAIAQIIDEYAEDLFASSTENSCKLSICECFFKLINEVETTDKPEYLLERVKLYIETFLELVGFENNSPEQMQERKSLAERTLDKVSSLKDDYMFKVNCEEIRSKFSDNAIKDRNYFLALHYIQKKQPEKAIEFFEDFYIENVITCISKSIEYECFNYLKLFALDYIDELTQLSKENDKVYCSYAAVELCSIIYSHLTEGEMTRIIPKIDENYNIFMKALRNGKTDEYDVRNMFESLLSCHVITGIDEYRIRAFSLVSENKMYFDEYYADEPLDEALLEQIVKLVDEENFVMASWLFGFLGRSLLKGFSTESKIADMPDDKRILALNLLLKVLSGNLPIEEEIEVAFNVIKTLESLIHSRNHEKVFYNDKATVDEKRITGRILDKVDDLLNRIDDDMISTYYLAKLYDKLGVFYEEQNEKSLKYRKKCKYNLIAEYQSIRLNDVDDIAREWYDAGCGYSEAENYAMAYECFKQEREVRNGAAERNIYEVHSVTERCIDELLNLSDSESLSKEIDTYISELEEMLAISCSVENPDYFIDSPEDIAKSIYLDWARLADVKMYASAERIMALRGLLLLDSKCFQNLTRYSLEELHNNLINAMSNAEKNIEFTLIDEFLDWCREYIDYCEDYNAGNQEIKELCVSILSDLVNIDFEMK